MVTYKFLPDLERCIRCGGCEVACKQENNVPIGIRRIRVVTINEGVPGEKNIPMPCMHCDDPPCVEACPTKALSKREDGIVLNDKSKCIGCGYCSWACPFGAPQFLGGLPFTLSGKMDKCTFCVLPFEGGEQKEPKPRCAAFCSTKALLAGDASEINEVYRKRAAARLQPGTIV
ncbi:MAG: 4Fe-4S dicluster domain-containing protein [Methanocellales archaeon]|nr:4Fe-4S dicluster domain-containing protein [Methanocellales archaeon]